MDALDTVVVDHLSERPFTSERLTSSMTFFGSVSLRAERECAQAALERARPHVNANTLTPAALERFGQNMRERISSDDIGLRKTDLCSDIEQIEVADDVVRIVGDKATLEQAIVAM
ncbi:hypothetical protein [Devosia sp. RR2S18]|uniref:hypothetical protein n=1 Tax=Devosia rhizosphaerae TaxID=3049774 RepID=UPI002542300B|nr:hypothetical protein [Devosia sp. RR2S18]WIJ24960.1 hypothetical protein QOV41_18425 [Devosia sp. RR2S18]